MLRDVLSPNNNFKQSSDGMLLFYDNSRNKFLSTDRQIFGFGINNKNVKGTRWLRNSGIPTNIPGFAIPRNATITAITIESGNVNVSSYFNIKLNGSNSNILSVHLDSEQNKIQTNLNYDINQGDYIQVQLDVELGKSDYPTLMLELAWR